MSLTELIVDDVRCIEHAELRLHAGQNLIWGGNGSGKTSLLEAIFLLGRGRSFRTRNSERLIRYGKDRLVVFGRVAGDASSGGAPVAGQPLGVQVSRADGTLARIGGATAKSLTELTQVFPVRSLIPGFTSSWKRVATGDDAGWIGECSTWNLNSGTGGFGIPAL